MAIFDPSRLYSTLLNTGLQVKDNALYQVVHDLIAALVTVNKQLNGVISSSSSSVTNINNVIQQLVEVSEFSSDDFQIPGPIGPAGPIVPYHIGINETFLVPLYKQALFSMNIDNEGIIEVDGFLIEVDGIPESIIAVNQFNLGDENIQDELIIPGPPGLRGNNGINGINGIDGIDGEDGLSIPGPSGINGTQGLQGLQGSSGLQGDDGIDGDDSFIPGIQGIQGIQGDAGIQGSQGFPGLDGIDGDDSNWPQVVPAYGLTGVNDTNVTLTLGGSPANSLLAATSITLGWSGTLAVGRGGTGVATVSAGFNANIAAYVAWRACVGI
jgi:hypothetical protein